MVDTDTELTDGLTLLIDTCHDSEQGFRSCAAQAHAMSLQLLLTLRADALRRAAAELKALLGHGHGDANPSRRPTAPARGWWADKATLAGYSDVALLAECERGEDIGLRRCRYVLDQDVLPRIARAVVQRHCDDSTRHRAHIRNLRARQLAALTPATHVMPERVPSLHAPTAVSTRRQ
jgi:uncharacterized protein (TIGR02284 family)